MSDSDVLQLSVCVFVCVRACTRLQQAPPAQGALVTPDSEATPQLVGQVRGTATEDSCLGTSCHEHDFVFASGGAINPPAGSTKPSKLWLGLCQ